MSREKSLSSVKDWVLEPLQSDLLHKAQL